MPVFFSQIFSQWSTDQWLLRMMRWKIDLDIIFFLFWLLNFDPVGLQMNTRCPFVLLYSKMCRIIGCRLNTLLSLDISGGICCQVEPIWYAKFKLTCLSINESLIKKHDLLFLLFVFYAVLCWLLLPPFSFFFSVMFTSLFRLYSKYLTDIIFSDF